MPFPANANLEARKKAHFMCVACHAPFVEVHHIIPEAEGGPNTLDNAAPLCSGCHGIYGSNPAFRNQIRQMRDAWFDVCEKRFGQSILDIAQKLDSMALTLRTLGADQAEYKETLDEIKTTVVSSLTGTTDVIKNAQTYEEVVDELDFFGKQVYDDGVRAIAHDSDIASLTVIGIPDRPGTAAALVQTLVESGIFPDTIFQNTNIKGTTDLTVMVSKSELAKAMNVMDPITKSIGAEDCVSNYRLASVAIIGKFSFSKLIGYVGTMFRTLAKYGISIRFLTSSYDRITCYIDEGTLREAVRALHRAFEL